VSGERGEVVQRDLGEREACEAGEAASVMGTSSSEGSVAEARPQEARRRAARREGDGGAG